MVNRGYIKNLPVDPKVFRVADALLGRPTQVQRAQMKRKKNGKMKVYRSLRERMLALEMDLMLWYGHAFMVTVTIPMSHTHITHLGTYNGETPFKDSNTLIKASDEAISYS